MQFDAIILAGGAGKNEKRSEKLKNLLKVDATCTLLYQTLIMVLSVSPHRVIVISDKESLNNVQKEVDKAKMSKEYLDLIEKQDIILAVITEPECKGSAPAVALGAYVLDHPNNHNVTLLLPSDKIIANNSSFKQALKSAYTVARKSYLTTLGIAPTRPATSYEYIETDNKKSKKWYTITSFKERPDFERAMDYYKDENFYYNSGIQVFRPSDMVAEIEKYMPEFAAMMKRISGCKISDAGFNNVLADIYGSLEAVSIEKALFEKTKNAAVIPTSLRWIDLSTWSALVDECKEHTGENEMYENVVCINKNHKPATAPKRSKERQIRVVGVEGFMLVDTDDALLVCDRENAGDVKALSELLGEDEANKLI